MPCYNSWVTTQEISMTQNDTYVFASENLLFFCFLIGHIGPQSVTISKLDPFHTSFLKVVNPVDFALAGSRKGTCAK